MGNNQQTSNTHIAIIGSGMAGLSAAVHLQQLGHSVSVYEAAQHAGGRTRSVHLARAQVDNGQHILLGAYHQTLNLLHRCQIPEHQCLQRFPLDWRVGRLHLRTSKLLPSPINLLLGLIQAVGITWSEKISLGKLMLGLYLKPSLSKQDDISVAQWLAERAQSVWAIEHIWRPICLAALNTPIEQASAYYFCHVIRDGLLGNHRASDMLLCKQDLSQALINPIIQYLQSQGVNIVYSHRLISIEKLNRGFSLQFANQQLAQASHVILAIPPANLSAFQDSLPQAASWTKQIHYQPITTVYLQYAANISLPAPMLGFPHTSTTNSIELQWLFDRGQFAQQAGLIAVVLSAHGKQDALDNQQLSAEVIRLMSERYPEWGAPLWAKCIREKRATHRCDVGLTPPNMLTETPGLLLAGDYLHPHYPATIEAAVQSGLDCARWIEAQGISR